MNDICRFCGYVPVKIEEEDGYSVTRCTICSAIIKKEPVAASGETGDETGTPSGD